MPTHNFNNKRFSLIENSENGKVNSDTIFDYSQKGEVVTANYYGGSVIYGQIIALLKGDYLDMRYQCLTTDHELKSGKAIAKIILLETGKLRLDLNWEWLDGNSEHGTSQYIEN